MDENKVIRPMDFVRLTNIDELNVIKDTKNHIGLVKEVSRDGRMSIIWIGETYSQLAWFKSSELEVVDNLVSILTCGLANFRGDGAVGLIMDNCLRGHGMRCLTLSMNLKTSLWIRGQKRMKLY